MIEQSGKPWCAPSFRVPAYIGLVKQLQTASLQNLADALGAMLIPARLQICDAPDFIWQKL